jgi:hypothetical protein
MRTAAGRPRWTARIVRALGFDGNPLRRASDRAEAWIRAGLLVIFLTGGPIAALFAGLATAHAGAETSGPPQRGDFAFAGAITAVMTLAVTALALLLVLRLTQCFLNWRRLAAWEAAWRVTGPQWTGHRS